MDVSIDIETFSTRQGSIIASIGAVSFCNGTILEEFYNNIDIEYAQKIGLTIDASTVVWWLKQSDEARAAILKPGYSVASALSNLTSFLDAQRAKNDSGRNFHIWAKPVIFDIVLLEAAYCATNIKIPWYYSELRDVETFLKYTRFDQSSIPFEGTEHHALYDAAHQARLVMGARRLLRKHEIYYNRNKD